MARVRFGRDRGSRAAAVNGPVPDIDVIPADRQGCVCRADILDTAAVQSRSPDRSTLIMSRERRRGRRPRQMGTAS